MIGFAGRVAAAALATLSLLGATAAPEGARPVAQEGEIGTALVGGTASHVGTRFGDRYLALPEGPGVLVEVCGNAACVTRRSTDAGPDLAMQRQGRVVDLNAYDFERVCGCPASVGLIEVTVEYLAEIELPATDTEGNP